MDNLGDYILGGLNSASNAVLGAANMYLTSQAKKADRRFAEQMYTRQLADNERLWNMQNYYNSPTEQMKRLHAAGLNVALMYPQGNTGTAASPAKSADSHVNYGPVPQLNQIDLMGSYYQVENMRLQNEKLEQEIKESKSRVPLNEAKTNRETVETRQITDNKEWLDMLAHAKAEAESARSRLFSEQAHVYLDKEQKVDENGQPVFDSDGLPVYTENNYFDESGKVISPMQYQFEVEMARQRQTLNKIIEDTELTKQQIITEMSKPDVMAAQVAYLMSAAHLNHEQASNLYRMYTLGLLNYDLQREQFNFNKTNFQNWPQLLSRILRWLGIDLEPNQKQDGPIVNPGGMVGVPFVGTPIM